MYKDGNTRGSWASRGVDAFYLGPALDHYRYNHYYISETRAYRISGSAELFLQHCQLPTLTPHQHFRALMDELSADTDRANQTTNGRRLLHLLAQQIDNLLQPPGPAASQRVTIMAALRDEEQRVMDTYPILPIPQITDTPPIMQSHNPTAKQTLAKTPHVHRGITQNNTPGIMPCPTLIEPDPPTLRSLRRQDHSPAVPTRTQPPWGRLTAQTPIPLGARQCVITRLSLIHI